MFPYAIINKPAVTDYADTYAIINKPVVTVYAAPLCVSSAADEGLYGNVCRILGKEQDFFYIISSYGYAGYVKEQDVLPAREPDIRNWLDNVMVVDGSNVDILDAPSVRARLIMTLPRGALVRPLVPSESMQKPSASQPKPSTGLSASAGQLASASLSASASQPEPSTGQLDSAGLPKPSTGLSDSASLPEPSACLSDPAGLPKLSTGMSEDGYVRVLLADGSEGYIASNRLIEKRFGEELLELDPSFLIELQKNAASTSPPSTGEILTKTDKQILLKEFPDMQPGKKIGFDFKRLLDRWYGTVLPYQKKEAAFRDDLVSTAKKYMDVQYRWGGRSSFGLDCSGLTHMSYLLCGVHIFRDAAIVKEYPLRRLELSWKDNMFDLSNLDSGVLKAGDTLYFPGHVAMYLGDGMYIHSTGKAGDMGVVVNSLRPEHPLFRKDLLEKLYAAAGLRL